MRLGHRVPTCCHLLPLAASCGCRCELLPIGEKLPVVATCCHLLPVAASRYHLLPHSMTGCGRHRATLQSGSDRVVARFSKSGCRAAGQVREDGRRLPCLRPRRQTAGCKALPLSCVLCPTAFMAKTPPFPCLSAASHLRQRLCLAVRQVTVNTESRRGSAALTFACVSQPFFAKTVPFLAVRRAGTTAQWCGAWRATASTRTAWQTSPRSPMNHTPKAHRGHASRSPRLVTATGPVSDPKTNIAEFPPLGGAP